MNSDIEEKINKYKKYVPGELYSHTYTKQLKQETAIQERHHIADLLFNECPFHITPQEKNEVHHLINMIKNFKEIHGKASNETIILAFIFYVKIGKDTNIRIQKYKITKKYQLTHNTFEIILCKLNLYFLKESYIIPVEPKGIDHNLLYKG